jgi:hypothetical protein
LSHFAIKKVGIIDLHKNELKINGKNSISQDMVFCRLYRGLQKCIEKRSEAKALKCSIHYWAGAWEVEEMFNKL